MGHLSFSGTGECVTSGGLLSTNILRLCYNMATGHAPLSTTTQKNEHLALFDTNRLINIYNHFLGYKTGPILSNENKR